MVTAGPTNLSCHVPAPVAPPGRPLVHVALGLAAGHTVALKVARTPRSGAGRLSPARRWQLPLTSALSRAPACWPHAALGHQPELLTRTAAPAGPLRSADRRARGVLGAPRAPAGAGQPPTLSKVTRPRAEGAAPAWVLLGSIPAGTPFSLGSASSSGKWGLQPQRGGLHPSGSPARGENRPAPRTRGQPCLCTALPEEPARGRGHQQRQRPSPRCPSHLLGGVESNLLPAPAPDGPGRAASAVATRGRHPHTRPGCAAHTSAAPGEERASQNL